MQSVDLSLARRAQTPQDFFSDLSEQCRALDILQQDVYGDFNADLSSSWLRKFESELADYFGKGNAVFIPSGVMAQNIVLSLTCKSRPAPAPFMCHFSSHLLLHEQSAYLELLGLSVIIMHQDKDAINQKPVTYKSFIAALNAAGDHIPAACLIECPHREIGGKCTPLQDSNSYIKTLQRKWYSFAHGWCQAMGGECCLRGGSCQGRTIAASHALFMRPF